MRMYNCIHVFTRFAINAAYKRFRRDKIENGNCIENRYAPTPPPHRHTRYKINGITNETHVAAASLVVFPVSLLD